MTTEYAASPGAALAWWSGFALAALLHLALSLAVGARLFVGGVAAERVADASGLPESLDPGSRSWSAVTLARTLAFGAAVLCVALGPLREHAFLAGAVAVAALALLGRAVESLLAPRWPAQTLSALALVLRSVDLVLGPLVAPLARAHASLTERARRARSAQDEEEAREEQLEEYIRDAEEGGILEEEEGELLREIVDAGEVTVREVMTPRVDVVALAAGDTLEQAASLFTRSRHSRLLVHEGGLDRVVGVLPVRDLLPHLRPATAPGAPPVQVRALMRPVMHVPAAKRVLELLRELQEERQQIAVVVDEYGNTAGIVSLEDLVEEIVGEIRDEHEMEDEAIRAEAGGSLMVDGLTPVADLAERLGCEIAADDVGSVGGLVFARLGRAPRLGDKIEAAPGVTLEVVRLRGRRIGALRASSAAAPPGP